MQNFTRMASRGYNSMDFKMDTHRTENTQIAIIKWWSRCGCERIQRNTKNNLLL